MSTIAMVVAVLASLSVFFSVVAYFAWGERREKERKQEQKMRELEKKVADLEKAKN